MVEKNGDRFIFSGAGTHLSRACGMSAGEARSYNALRAAEVDEVWVSHGGV
jgi:hypothetical protein